MKKSGLKAYHKEPDFKYKGKLYVIIGPITYSGGSEFANMVYSQNSGTFVGEETGGGLLGNTSGHISKLELPHSGLICGIPVLKYKMKVEGGEFGRGLIPNFNAIPTIEEYLSNKNKPVEFILSRKANK